VTAIAAAETRVGVYRTRLIPKSEFIFLKTRIAARANRFVAAQIHRCYMIAHATI